MRQARMFSKIFFNIFTSLDYFNLYSSKISDFRFRLYILENMSTSFNDVFTAILVHYVTVLVGFVAKDIICSMQFTPEL